MKQQPPDQRYRPVTLIDDPDFLGYFFAIYIDADGQPTGKAAISVSNPGQSGLVGCVAIERERLVECQR